MTRRRLTPVEFRPQARKDLAGYAEFLESQREGVGDSFITAVMGCEATLASFPLSGRLFEARRHLRRMIIPGFRNYMVIYRVLKRKVSVVRILHGAMNLPDAL